MKTKVNNETKEFHSNEDNEYYIVSLGVNLVTKELLAYLHTICGCYDGRHYCSHITGFLLFIRLAQMCQDNQDIFESSFPENPISLQNTLTLIENTSFTTSCKESRKRTAEEKELLSRNELD